MKRAAVLACGDFFVGLAGLGKSQIAHERDDRTKLGIKLLDAAHVDFGEALGGELVLFDPAGELGYRGEGDVRIARRQRAGVGFAADELIALWAGGLAGEDRMAA